MYLFTHCSEVVHGVSYISDVDNVLQRMTIIGVILSFRGLVQEALYDVSKLLQIKW